MNTSSFAVRTPTTHGRNIETTPEPNRTSTYPKTASSAATARSHASIRSVPPARQYECTDAMTGFGLLEDPEQPLRVAVELSVPLGRVLGPLLGVLVEVVAGAERPARPAEDHDVHVVVLRRPRRTRLRAPP